MLSNISVSVTGRESSCHVKRRTVPGSLVSNWGKWVLEIFCDKSKPTDNVLAALNLTIHTSSVFFVI